MSDPSAPQPVYAPPVGYVAPSGFPAPSASPGAPSPLTHAFAQPEPPRSSRLGIVALVAALAAAVLAPVFVIVAGVNIGAGLGNQAIPFEEWSGIDPSVLTPVREWVLVGELAFWGGTILGIWAIIQGIVAIALRAGRVQGIVAVVSAAVGPLVFAIAVQLSITLGYGL